MMTAESSEVASAVSGKEGSIVGTRPNHGSIATASTRQRRTNGAIHSYLALASSSPLSYRKVESTMLPDRELWKLISERRWGWTTERITTHPYEVQQFITYPSIRSKSCSNKLLPLHLACALRPLPPFTVIAMLLETYPQATSIRSTDGYLPIHYAANLQSRHHTSANSSSNHPESHRDRHHPHIIHQLLRWDPASALSPATCDRTTSLHIAAATADAPNGVTSHDDTEIFNLLLLFSARSHNRLTHQQCNSNCPEASERNTSMPSFLMASLDIKDKYGKTPIDYAWGQVQLVCTQCGGRRQEQTDAGDGDDTLAHTSATSYCRGRCRDGRSASKATTITVSVKYIHPLLKSEIEQQIMTMSQISDNNNNNKSEEEESEERDNGETMDKVTRRNKDIKLSKSSAQALDVRLNILQYKLRKYLTESADNEGRNDDDDTRDMGKDDNINDEGRDDYVVDLRTVDCCDTYEGDNVLRLQE